MEERDALALRDRLLALHGGAAGLRDEGMLKSALARPQQHLAYARLPTSLTWPRPIPRASFATILSSMATATRENIRKPMELTRRP